MAASNAVGADDDEPGASGTDGQGVVIIDAV
jgi:hypothetical protein